MKTILSLGIAVLGVQLAVANPYPDPNAVPKDPVTVFDSEELPGTPLERAEGIEVLRVNADWDEASDTFSVGTVAKELSGTPALLKRALNRDPLGSYQATLVNRATGEVLFHCAIGTGQEFRRLSRSAAFRFPVPSVPVNFVLVAENPETGVMEEVLNVPVEIPSESVAPQTGLTVRTLRTAKQEPSLALTIYAEGYLAGSETKFFQDAERAAKSLEAIQWPGVERFNIVAVFAPSKTQLGTAKKLGMPIPERDSFLGLYHPYWRDFGRWYHVVYPTRVERYRRAIGSVAYDYPVVLVDSREYWGVGNFNELTAIPSGSSSFSYLLHHELGHYFGLNEEYEGGGPTELAFAPGIDEPWSQNITFVTERSKLKWRQFVADSTPVPTPDSYWKSSGPIGAYEGGYADTEPLNQSHKPGHGCVMSSAKTFCAVCKHALQERVKYDVGGSLSVQ